MESIRADIRKVRNKRASNRKVTVLTGKKGGIEGRLTRLDPAMGVEEGGKGTDEAVGLPLS